MSKTSPTQRTLAAQKKLGRKCGIVERFIQRPGSYGFRKDLFGFIDLIAISPKEGTIGVQSCGSSWSEHVKKIESKDVAPNVRKWLEAGNKAELWAWRKVKHTQKNGKKVDRIKPRIGDICIMSEAVKVVERKEK